MDVFVSGLLAVLVRMGLAQIRVHGQDAADRCVDACVGCLVVRLPFGRAGRGRASFACDFHGRASLRTLYPHTRAHVNVPASPLLVSPQAALWRVMCVC